MMGMCANFNITWKNKKKANTSLSYFLFKTKIVAVKTATWKNSAEEAKTDAKISGAQLGNL